jgi:hypothetical protein
METAMPGRGLFIFVHGGYVLPEATMNEDN